MVNLEKTVALALQVAIEHEECSASSYMRGLLIKDLQDRGLLTTKMLAQMAS